MSIKSLIFIWSLNLVQDLMKVPFYQVEMILEEYMIHIWKQNEVNQL